MNTPMVNLTDQEIVAACARAVGAVFERNVEVSGGRRQDFVVLNGARMEEYWYNPLADRAQAMELVELLDLEITSTRQPDGEVVRWVKHGEYGDRGDGQTVVRAGSRREGINLLRAICLCAARVQIEKEKNANG